MVYRIQKRNLRVFGVMATCCLLILFVQCMISIQYIKEEKKMQQELADEVLRFHILANSDNEIDQKQKLQVRDAVIKVLEPILEGTKDNEESKKRIMEHMKIIENAAKEITEEYPVTISLVTDYFPSITYGEMKFPAGNYDALRIEIGEAKGHNWWCLLYPGLCFSDTCKPVIKEDGKEKLRMVLEEDTYEWLQYPNKIKIRFRWF